MMLQFIDSKKNSNCGKFRLSELKMEKIHPQQRGLLFESEYGFVLDQAELINGSYEAHTTQMSFSREKPYFTESSRRKKKRKIYDPKIHPKPLPDSVLHYLREGHEFTKKGAKTFCSDIGATGDENKMIAADGPNLAELCVLGFDSDKSRYFNEVVTNSDPAGELTINIDGTSFLLPPSSSFLLADVSNFDTLLETRPETGYKLIVADPPWFNKSVKRCKKYATMNESALKNLQVRELINKTEGYIAVWVTNNPVLHEFVKTELLPSWGAVYYGTWYWLKVCNDGELVIPLNSLHRKPYEHIIIGKAAENIESDPSDLSMENGQLRQNLPDNSDQSTSLKDSNQHATHALEGHTQMLEEHTTNTLEGDTEKVGEASSKNCSTSERVSQPERRIIFSVPGPHSIKPQLFGLLSSFFNIKLNKSGNECLEIFARNLCRGCTSFGNEVLKFQNVAYFK